MAQSTYGIPAYGSVAYRPTRPVTLAAPTWGRDIIIDLTPGIDWLDLTPPAHIAADKLAQMKDAR